MGSDWRAEVRAAVENLVDKAVTGGALQEEVYAEAIKEIERLKIADERDPDPSDDMSELTLEEPANDWPAAKR